jgi:RNA polymerase sigma-70 factor (ECF subfamily)
LNSDLIARCRSGDPEALETLVHEHQAAVYRLCLSVLHDPGDAEDATQESFIAAINALDKYRGDSQFRTWLFAIALNSSRAHLRQRGRQGRLESTLIENTDWSSGSMPSPEREMMQTESSQALWLAINQLDEKHRLPIILRYYHEMSTQEIAEILNVNVGTIHSRLNNARTRLGGELQRQQTGSGRASQ